MQNIMKKMAATAVMGATLLLPMATFAADAWSSAVVSQSQFGGAAGKADATQNAQIVADVEIAGQARATTVTTGSQGLWNAGKFSQNQTLAGSANIWWEPTSWPSEAKATTSGGFWQKQNAWGGSPLTLTQDGKTWQNSQIGTTRGTLDATAKQHQTGIIGDAGQSQDASGSTGVAGAFIEPPFPTCNSCDISWLFGGKLTQTVKVFVQNVLDF